jgi:CRP/FNR family transcriptional regulator
LDTDTQLIPRGTVLFRPGDPCRGFVVVNAGSIRVTLGARNGREVVLYRVGRGDVCLQTFTCLVQGRDYSAEGVVESELRAEIIPTARFFERLAVDDAFRQLIFTAVARRFADFEQLVENVALTGLRSRLARALLKLADADLRVHATHDQLARETASGRAAVSRQIAALAAESVLRAERGGVTILDAAALAALADTAG